MRIVLLALIISSFGCATKIKDEFVSPYIGKSGYFHDQRHSFNCSKVTIKSVRMGASIILEVESEGKTYSVHTEDDFNGKINEPIKLSWVDKNFKDHPPKFSGTVNLDGKKMSKTDALCMGHVWIGISQKELLFAKGRPNNINRTVVPGLTSEQWVYGNTYIYLDNGKVTSWQNFN